jgi:LysR family transcriptional regulator, glycine cleavage system transcriptional activator
MTRNLPNLALLIGFEAAARHLSFSKAGDEVCLTQSAVGRQVKKLEEYVGLSLFERKTRSLELTEQGRILFEVVSESLARLSDTIESLRHRPSACGLKVATTTSFASMWLIPRLARFRALCPEVLLHIEADNRVVNVEPGAADLAISYRDEDLALGSAEVLLSREVLFPVCSPALLRRLGSQLDVAQDLRHHILLHLADPDHEWPWLQWPDWLSSVGVDASGIDTGLRFSHLDQVLQSAVMGHGVALGSSPLVDHWLESGVLVAPLPQRVRSPRVFVLRLGERRDEAVNSLVAWLQSTINTSSAQQP